MTEDEGEKRHRHSYDVEWIKRVFADTKHKRGRLGRTTGRITGAAGSFQGVFILFLPPLIIFGTILTVVYTLNKGPLVFLGTMAVLIGGLTLLADRKMGKSLQFGESHLWRGIGAQVLGASLAIGFILLLLALGRIPIPIIP